MSDGFIISEHAMIVMAKGLKDFIKEKRIIPNKIPKPIIVSAILFMNMAAAPTLPETCSEQEVICWSAVANIIKHCMEPRQIKSQNKINKRIQLYAFLLEKIDWQSPCQLDEFSSRYIQIFHEMSILFEELAKRAKTAVYKKSVEEKGG